MKLALLFLTVLVAASNQQFERPRRMLWWPAYLPQRVLNNHQPFNYGDIEDGVGPSFRYFKSKRPVPYLQGDEDNPMIIEQEYEENRNDDVQSRVNGYRPFKNSQANKQQNGRFFFNSGNNNNNVGNPLLKTVTFTLTSTCTALTFTTCIPGANFAPNPPPACRRKRQIDQLDDDYESQFPVSPTQVRLVMPTEQPSPTLLRNYRQTTADIASSKEENVVNGSNDFLGQAGNQSRKKRLYYLWQSFATGTTITTWVVISSTYTATFIPVANLACLPPGYFVCPVAGK